MTYLAWNDRLAEHFFPPAKAGRKVHLFATHELIDKLGQPSQDGFENFVEAVKSGPPWSHRSGLCQCALEALRGWRTRRLPHPPYIAYLALFVIAAGIEDDFPPHAYYPRLRKVLGEEPEPRALPSFDRMLELWDDLERWSNVDCGGERGVFQTRLLGSLIYVGVPRAQTLLSEEELHNLPVVFSRAGLDPTSIPSDREMSTIIAAEGRDILRNRTLRILKSTAEADVEVHQALVEAISEELREWDGETFETNDGGDGIRYQTGTLRLCCDLDRTAGRVRMSFRARLPGDFPEEELLLQIRGNATVNGSRFICEEWGRGWSRQLETNTGIVDAAKYDWNHSFVLEDANGDWRFRFPGAQVRIFMEGRSEGLPGLVEVRRLPSQSRFYLLATGRDSVHIESWGASGCDGWEELKLTGGMPLGWRVFHATRVRSDEAIRVAYPALALPSNVSISLRGGIRVARGNRYFDFAPPSVALEGANIDRLTFNGVNAGAPTKTGEFEIPSTLPELANEEPGRVLIEARLGDATLDRRTIYLAKGGWSWTAPINGLRLTSFGAAIDSNGGPSLSGARADGISAAEFNFAGAIPVTVHGTVHYVGREAGQIVHWPAESIPEDWSPVWAIVSRRRGQVMFCGTNPSAVVPERGHLTDRKKLKVWREFLWVRRKQLRPPAHIVLRRLWKEFQEIARHV